MSTLTVDQASAHVAFVRRLLALTNRDRTRRIVETVLTHGQDPAAPIAGRLALIGTAAAPRVAVVTKVTPTKTTVSYFTDNALRHARTMAAHNSHPIHFDSWPDTYREHAVKRYATDPIGRTQYMTADAYAQHHYEWAVKLQAVYRGITHAPWVAFAPIRNTTIPRAKLVMVPETGGNE